MTNDAAAVAATFYSQYGEDRFLAERGLLPDRGVFIDVGAGDPIRFSNSYYVEQLGWKGVCVDAGPRQVQALRQTRTCQVEWAAVASADGEATFLECEDPDYSTVLDHLPTVAQAKGWAYTQIRVPALRLDSILAKHRIDRVDLLSIDTEGTELEVCASLDWSKHRPAIVLIEHATIGRASQESEIRAFFVDLPYRLLNRTSANLIFAETRLPRFVRKHASFRAYRSRRSSERVARRRHVDASWPIRPCLLPGSGGLDPVTGDLSIFVAAKRATVVDNVG